NVVVTQDSAVRALLENAIRLQEDRPQPVLSGSFPIVVGDKTLFRTAAGVRAVSSATGKVLWDAPSDWGLSNMLGDNAVSPHIQAWLGSYFSMHPHVLLENSALGTLSS